MNTLTHAFVSTRDDGPDPSLVQPSNWNRGHLFVGGATGSLLVRDTTDTDFGASWVDDIATGNVLLSGGIGALPTWGKVDLAAHVTGSLAVAAGGTGQSTYAVGDLLFASASGALNKLASVADGSYLRSGGVATAPVWSTLVLPNAAVAGDLMVATALNTVGRVADVATGSVLVSGGVGVVPAWSATPTMTSVTLGTTGSLAWSTDLFLVRGAANTLGLRNGTNAQTFNVYNTFTDASNYERLTISAGATFTSIIQSASGTGTHRALVIGTDAAVDLIFNTNSTQRWHVNSSGNFNADTDNTYDIGQSGAVRPRTGYFGTSLVVGATPASAGDIRVKNAFTLTARNAANTADGTILSTDANNRSLLGGVDVVVANAAIITIGASTVVEGFLSVISISGGVHGLFNLGGGGTAAMVGTSAATYSVVVGTASRVNVYFNGTSLNYELQNNSGASITIRLVMLGR